MKRILILGFILWMAQVNAQETPIQKRVNAVPTGYFSQQKLFIKKTFNQHINSFTSYANKITLLVADHEVLERIIKDNLPEMEIDVPVGETLLTLQLIRYKDQQQNVDRLQRTGKTKPTEAFYYGVIKGQQNSLVAVSFFNKNIMGVIANKVGYYTLGKSGPYDATGDEYVLYNEKDMKFKKNFYCGMDEKALLQSVSRITEPNSITGTAEKCIKVYIEADYSLYQKFGSILSTKMYVQSLFQIVRTIFLNESINIYCDSIKVWSTIDPYASATDLSTMLTAFSSNLATTGYPGDLAHLLSARIVAGGYGAAPSLNVLCDPNLSQRIAVSTGLAYLAPAVSLPMPGEPMLMAHEIGHDLGSPHTHQCAWNGNCTAIDGCSTVVNYCSTCVAPSPLYPTLGGTVMSYCNLQAVGLNIVNGFGIQPGNLIRARVAAVTCLSTCASDCNADVTIKGIEYIGNYYTRAITESSTWIKTEGVTKVSGGSVKFDADVASYVQLDPGFETTADATSAFVAKAYNGCSTGAPSFTGGNFVPPISDKYLGISNNNGKINPVQVNSFAIFPNPAKGSFTLASDYDLNDTRIELFDLSGKLQDFGLLDINYRSRKIIVTNLSSGMYIIKLIRKANSEFRKILIL